MSAIGLVARKVLPGNMTASMCTIFPFRSFFSYVSPSGGIKLSIPPSRSRTYAQGAKRLLAGWTLLT